MSSLAPFNFLLLILSDKIFDWCGIQARASIDKVSSPILSVLRYLPWLNWHDYKGKIPLNKEAKNKKDKTTSTILLREDTYLSQTEVPLKQACSRKQP